MKCPACAFDNPAGFRFCGACGRSLAAEAGPAAGAAPAARRDVHSYTPNHLAQKILGSRAALAGERKQVTVLFADIERSMELAEQVDAEDWHRLLDRFFAILAEGVHRFEGTINQFTGDGIMALFGAPIAHEDHARRACHAALQLSHELRRWSEERKRTLGFGISVRMGVNSGEVVVGAIGDDLRMDYTAQGHTVGLAARMQQLAGPDRTYLTEHTAALVAGFFRLRDLGAFALKGVRRPVRVYDLEGTGDVRTRLDASRARGFSRFVGREAELGTLEAALAEAVAGAGGVVGIVANAGMGKSRLCHELAVRCRERGIHSSRGHALPHGRMIPFLPWSEQLRDDFGIAEADDDETAREKIAGRALRLDERLIESLPLLFDLAGVPDPARPSPPIDAEARHRRLGEAMQRLVRARGARDPAVLLFEDLHWMDRGSEALLAAVVDALAGTHTLLVVTFRPEYRPPWREAAGYRELALAPLAGADVGELLDALLGRDPSLAGLGERIRERAAGNPLFVEEVVRSLVEAGALAGAPGAYRLARPVERIDIPATVQAILAARIDRLDERQKAVLQAAAVIGRSFSEPVLARVAGVPPEELRSLLAELVAAELVHEERLVPVAEYAFRHPLTQEVAYRTQLAERRARAHEGVARAIEATAGGRLEERAALVAHHLEAAGERLEAARWSRRAARWLRRTDLAESHAHWRKVLRLLGELPESEETLRLGLEARAAVLSSGWLLGVAADEAARFYAESREIAARASSPSALALLTAQYAGIKASHREIEEYLRLSWDAVHIAEETGDAALRAAVWPPLVRAHLLSGRLREALELSERALASMPEDPRFGTMLGYSPWLNLHQLRANLLGYAGRWPEAARAFERVIEVAREHGHQALLASAASDYGWWAAFAGDSATALAQSRRGVEIAEKVGNQMARVYAYDALGVAELSAARGDEAVAALETALRVAREARTGEEAATQTLAHLAEAHLQRGDLPRARELAHESAEMARRHRAPAPECFACIVQARVHLAGEAGAGEREAAARALDRAQELIEATGARCYEPLVQVERGRLARLGVG